MAIFKSDVLVRRGLPLWYGLLTLFAIVEVGIAGYLVGLGDADGRFGSSVRNRVRFALFTALWVVVFGTTLAVGLWKRIRFLNTGFAHFIYLALTLIFWIAVGASIEKSIHGHTYPHKTTLRAAEWIAWIEAILTSVAFPWVLLGVAHAKEGLRGSVAV